IWQKEPAGEYATDNIIRPLGGRFTKQIRVHHSLTKVRQRFLRVPGAQQCLGFLDESAALGYRDRVRRRRGHSHSLCGFFEVRKATAPGAEGRKVASSEPGDRGRFA